MANIFCTVVKVLDEECGSGTRGDWVRRSIIVEHGEEYPRLLCVTAYSQEKCDTLAALSIGQHVQLSIVFESREYEGRWFTDVRLVRVMGVV